MKIDPRCKLTVGIAPNAAGEETQNIVIPPQFTIDFSINRQNLSSSQTAQFRIYNLGQKTRDLIYKDPYSTTVFQLAIQFHAGYNGRYPLCFNGFIQNASSDREGNDMVTTINAFDGGVSMANGFTAETIVGGSTIQYALNLLARALPNVSGQPIIGKFLGTHPRGKVLLGNTWQMILQQSGNLATIDNNQVKILQPNEAIEHDIGVISSASGLLGTPRRRPTSLEVDILFEPQLTLAGLVQLETRINPKNFNGIYKVQGFTHRGRFSPSTTGERISTVQLFYDKSLTTVSANLVQ